RSGLLSPRLFRCRNALLQSSLQSDRLMVLLEQILEGLSGEILEALVQSGRKTVNRLPGVVVELHALAGHDRFSSSIALIWVRLAPIRRTVEGPTPDAALGVLRLALSGLIGIAGLPTEVDGISAAHHRLAEVGHALRAAHRDNAIVAILRL